ncbi:hypothetical protein BS47DRAFT_1372373 [Hydnum rufescens UP504]|uniref:Conserved oligomeric Golgi complex subunit 7 n=1 Tax=Hydnum rufescens UP504 TaxID=1448309 RepID=A0A9P6AYF5_9AGAM|nr:hypothetical protein BS47DRAFT_1372373 [Hydnum rufescens UP504]
MGDSSESEASQPDLAALDQRVSYLSTRVQVLTQDTATHLEQTIEDISRTVPRLTYDLQFMRESGLSLQLGLKGIENKTRSTSADDPTTAALERLHFLSTIKSRMEASRDVLREAESWSVLESEVSGLISVESYAKAGERLAEANKSMVVFQNTSEYESRRALMISLQNQLEAAVSSALVAAINSRDVTACRTYFSIFGNIQRETEFRNYYNGSRRADLVTSWQAASLLDCDEPMTSSTPLSLFLNSSGEEQTNIPAIFPDPQPSLSAFIQSTLDALAPSLSQRLAEVSEYYGAAALPELIKSFRMAEEFAVSVDQIMGKIGYSALFLAHHSPSSPAVEEATGHSRRLSKRISMSRRIGAGKTPTAPSVNVLSGGGGGWENALFESFIDIQTEYSAFENRLIDRELARITTSLLESARNTSSDASRILQERSAAVFGMVEESLNRCIIFTHGYGAVGLVDAINYTFKTFLEASQRDLIPRIRQSGSGQNGRLSSPSTTLSPTSGTAADTFEELDYAPEDWSDFQLALHLLETCRVIRERLLVFEVKVKSTLVQVSTSFRLARADPHGLYLSGTTRGEAELLLQSSLNSAELHTLLDTIDPTGGTSESPVNGVVFGTALNVVRNFTRACQLCLQNIILKPLHAHLSSYATSSIWSSADPEGTRGAFDLHIPSFSLSPSPVILRVAEGLLNLPRLFEVYADDDALAFSIESLPFVDEESLLSLAESEPPRSPRDDRPGASRRQSASPPSSLRRLSIASTSSIPIPIQPGSPTSMPALSPEMVTSTWLYSLTHSLLSHLTSDVLPSVKTLSAHGAAQLSSDLAYLSNIIRALNVEFDDLERWKELVDLKDDEGRRRYEAKGAEARLGDGGGQESGKRIWDAVARMRGWDSPSQT